MQYTEIFCALKIGNFQLKIFDIFLIFAQNIDCGYSLMSTHNLCFGAKIRIIGIPMYTQFCYIKVGFKGVYITRTCFHDVIIQLYCLHSRRASHIVFYCMQFSENQKAIKIGVTWKINLKIKDCENFIIIHKGWVNQNL